MEALDDSNFGAISRGSGAFAADGLSFTHTGHTLDPAMQTQPLSRFVPVSIEAQQLLRNSSCLICTRVQQRFM